MAGLVALTAATLVAPSTGRTAPPDGARRIEVQGHRGARARRPENTLAAFRYALAVGVDTLELDVVVTRDDRLVVSHDLHVNPAICRVRRRGGRRLARLKRPVAIRALRLAELGRYDCGATRNPRFAKTQKPAPGERIPTLAQVLALVHRHDRRQRGRRGGPRRAVRLNIEIKRVPGRADLAPPPRTAVALLVRALKAHKLLTRTTLQSFDHRVLAFARRLAPRLTRVVLVAETRPDYVAVARAVGARIVSPHQRWITAADVRAIHKAGLRVVPWTANTVAEWRRLVRLGVDGIISDDPAALIRYLRGRKLRR